MKTRPVWKPSICPKTIVNYRSYIFFRHRPQLHVWMTGEPSKFTPGLAQNRWKKCRLMRPEKKRELSGQLDSRLPSARSRGARPRGFPAAAPNPATAPSPHRPRRSLPQPLPLFDDHSSPQSQQRSRSRGKVARLICTQILGQGRARQEVGRSTMGNRLGSAAEIGGAF